MTPTLHALFVHGMGRSPLSGWPMLRRLRKAGVTTSTFGYFVSLERFDDICDRLSTRVARLAGRGDYIVIGHSLGGILLRAAINDLPSGMPRPRRLFLLGSPVGPARLAQRLYRNPLYRALTGDCGAMLSSPDRMSAVASTTVPTTSVAGTRSIGWAGPRLFGAEVNDGIVSVAEVSAPWIRDQVRIDLLHTFLPTSTRVADVILARLTAEPR